MMQNAGLSAPGSPLYQRQIATCDDALTHKAWDGTPWMVEAYTGSPSNHERYRDIMEWCWSEFGPEASPIHGKPGNWHSGGVTVSGWTWMGFATQEMMQRFEERWPTPSAS